MTNQIKSVLVVEDDQFLSKIYQVKLEKAGFQVVIAFDGNQALEQIQKQLPAIILLDLMMPVKDGFSTIEDIRKNPQWENIPIIVASNLGQKEDIDRAIKLGANDFIIKSDTSLGAVIEKINKLLHL